MIPALVKQLGNSFLKSAGTTIDLTTTGATTAGNLIVACILFDNFTTASKPVVSSIGKMAGETNSWALLGAARSTSTSGGAFVSGEMWVILTTVNWSAAAYTVTLDSSVTQKAVMFTEYSGAWATTRSTTGTNYSTTTTAASASTTGTTPVTNDLALGMIIGSNVAAVQAGSNNTTAGSWSAASGFGSTGSGAASNNFGLSQYKVLTSGSHQTYANSAAMTAGNGAVVAILQSIIDPAITQAAYRFYDDGSETGSTALASQNTAYTTTGSSDVNLQLRVRLQSTTSATGLAIDDYTLQWEKNASGTWNDVAPSVIPAGVDAAASATDIVVASDGLTLVSAAQDNASFTVEASEPDPWSVGSSVTRTIWWKYTPLTSASVTFDTIQTIPNPYPDTMLALYSLSGSFTGFGSLTNVAFNDDYGPAPAPSLITYSVVSGTTYYIHCAAWGDRSMQYILTITNASKTAHTYSSVPYLSANVTDGAATTNRLGAGTGTFVAGKISEDGVVNDLAITANNYTELLYSLTVVAANVTNGDVLRFRLLRNGATTTMTYTQTPTINITSGGASLPPKNYRRPTGGPMTGLQTYSR